MKGLRSTVLGWIEERTNDLLETPRAWGSNEAVEMQVLLLLELRALLLQPEREIENPRRILDAYMAYLNKTYPRKPNRPLFQIVEEDELGRNLGRELKRFLDAFGPALLEENPFERPVALRQNYEGRIVEAVGTTAPPTSIERHGEIRAFDRDRGQLLLGKERLRCFVRPEFLPKVVAVGESARVAGRLFTPIVGRPFLLVDEPIEGPAITADDVDEN